MSQERLAEKADLHYNFYGRVERGETPPSIATIHKVAAALDASMQSIFAGL